MTSILELSYFYQPIVASNQASNHLKQVKGNLLPKRKARHRRTQPKSSREKGSKTPTQGKAGTTARPEHNESEQGNKYPKKRRYGRVI